MHATHWFLPWILSTYYDLRLAQLNNTGETIMFPLFFVSEMYFLYFGTPPPMP